MSATVTDPIANVADTPVNPTCISTTDGEPTEDVMDNESSTTTGTKASPCEKVDSKPVKPMLMSSTVTEPMLDVICIPVKETEIV